MSSFSARRASGVFSFRFSSFHPFLRRPVAHLLALCRAFAVPVAYSAGVNLRALIRQISWCRLRSGLSPVRMVPASLMSDSGRGWMDATGAIPCRSGVVAPVFRASGGTGRGANCSIFPIFERQGKKFPGVCLFSLFCLSVFMRPAGWS